MFIKKYYLCLLLLLFLSCNDAEEENGGNVNNDNEGTSESQGSNSDSNSDNNCEISDGEHSSTVDYTNPTTGYNATYDLEVDVEDCEVTVIYFPKGGWLDNSHITPERLDDNGDAEVEDDRGRTFNVHIDK